MRHFARSGWSSFLVAFLCSTTINATPLLSLKQATQIAIHNNRDLTAARANVAIAKARLVQAGLWTNPILNLSSNDDSALTNEGEYTRSAGFSQAFPISGRIRQQKKVARIDIAKAIVEIKEAERKLTQSVANAFYALNITQRRLHQLNYLSRLNRQLVDVTHNRYLAAEVSELDSNTAQLEYQRIKQEIQLLTSIQIGQSATFNQLLGYSTTQKVTLNPQLPKLSPLPDLGRLQAIALSHRPDRQAILLNVQRAGAEMRLARAERYADWILGLSVQQDKIVVEGAPPQYADKSLGVNLSVPLPLLNGNQGRILEAGATGTQALMGLRAIDLTIKTEVASNYEQLKLLQTTLFQTQKTSLQLTLKNISLARDAYKNGQVSLLNLIQIQRQQNELQTVYLTNWERYLQASVALCTAVGTGKAMAFCDYLVYKRN
ncbi:MAG: TolC family protein [Legionella sp.]|nr:TolC family protein [Legionella sp.]